MSGIRALHVSPYFAPAFVYGGPPRSILGLCRALGAEGVHVDVFTTTANGEGEPLAPSVDSPRIVDGVNVRYFPLAEPRALWRAKGARRALDSCVNRYDIVHVHGLWHLPGWHAAAAARRARVPYVISPRGMLEPQAMAIRSSRKGIAFNVIERRNLAGAACLHATSPGEAETLTRTGLARRVLVAPNGVDVNAVGVADAQRRLLDHGIDPGTRFVLFLGRIHPIKRLDLLANAAARLRSRNVLVVIAGPDEGGHRASMAPMFDALQVRARWLGPVDGPLKAALLSAACALVLCSDSESFGMTVAEAMAAATPVVTTRTCPWEEAQREGAGYWVPQTADAIAEALDELLEDEAHRRAMGARGRALVARRYTWGASAQIVAAEYRHLAARLHDAHVA